MHFSDNPNNFRNKKYIENMDKELKTMFRAYHKYISYRNKLLKELTINKEQEEVIKGFDKHFVDNIKRANKRISKEDFKDIY